MNRHDHDAKFKGFIEACEAAAADDVKIVFIHQPSVIGDDYEEIIENLNKLANKGLLLGVLAQDERHAAKSEA
jgi:hypothetical protein